MGLIIDGIAEVYSHIIDEDRRFNAQRFEEQFYNAKGLNNVSAGSKSAMPKFQCVTDLENKEQDNCADLIKKIKGNPDMLNLLKTLVSQI